MPVPHTAPSEKFGAQVVVLVTGVNVVQFGYVPVVPDGQVCVGGSTGTQFGYVPVVPGEQICEAFLVSVTGITLLQVAVPPEPFTDIVRYGFPVTLAVNV
jgi:hypothetical protein